MSRFIYISCAAALLGCSSSETSENMPASKFMPDGSPTKSVSAAEAYNRGVNLRATDKVRAVEEFSAAISLDPEFDIAIYNRALTYAELHRDQEALNDLATLKRMKSKQVPTLEALLDTMPALYCHQGHEAIENKNYAIAIEKFSAALLYAPDDPAILEWRAYAHQSKGDQTLSNRDVDAAKAARERGVESIVAEDQQKSSGS